MTATSIKKPGDYRSEKLRLVHGIESTENEALKISVSWETKCLVKQFDDIFYEFQFGHQPQTCLSESILKEITIKSFMLTEAPGIIIDNDSTGAFDRFICGIARPTNNCMCDVCYKNVRLCLE
jgi:hypothetical protein